MVIRGNTRGNGRQLAEYLLTEGGNDQIHILEVDGRAHATDAYLDQTLHGMSLTAELSKSQKGLYHAQINPAYAEDQRMSNKDWLHAADILAHELGLSEQRRVIVLHTKKNRTHAHVVFERYDHQTGKVISDSFSRLAQDRARKEMERVFEHQPTPHRNAHRPELKDALTGLWQQTETGTDFIQAVHEHGYLLAEGVLRHPFMVVDENGRSFDLVRQLKGVRIKEVRLRLRDEKLIPEKQAIEIMRQKKENGGEASTSQRQHKIDEKERAKSTFAEFWMNKPELAEEIAEEKSHKERLKMAGEFLQSSSEMTGKASQKESSSAQEEPDTFKVDGVEAQKSHDEEAEKYRATLTDFIRFEEEITAGPEPTMDADRLRQRDSAQQYFENEDMLTPETINDESHNEQSVELKGLRDDVSAGESFDHERMQRLIQEQKEIRERTHQRGKRRSR